MKGTKNLKSIFRWYMCVLAVGLSLLPGMSQAATPEPDGQVSMVTFFPMPYVTYNNLFINKKLDIGLLADYKVNLGSQDCKGQSSNHLLTNNTAVLPSIWTEDTPIFVRHGGGDLTLDLQSPVLVETISLGQKFSDADPNDHENVQMESAELSLSSVEIGGGENLARVAAIYTPQIDNMDVYAKGTSGGTTRTTPLNLPACPEGKVAVWKTDDFGTGSARTTYLYLTCE